MMSGHGTVETAVEATRLGAYDFVEKPLSLAKLLRTVERALDARARRPERQVRQPPAHSRARGAGRPQPHDRAAAQRTDAACGLQRAAAAARRIRHRSRDSWRASSHQSGPAAGGPFVVVDCRTLREDTAAATLLGAVDAAQPGCSSRRARARCSSATSRICRPRRSGCSAACSRAVASRAPAAVSRWRSRPASSPRRDPASSTACWPRNSAATCTRSCRCCWCACRRCATTPRTCRSCCGTTSMR